MNKFILALVSIFAVGLIGGAGFAGWYYQNQSYQSKTKELDNQISQKSAQVAQLKDAKDEKNYSPKDVATNFINEYKNGSEEKAKLYLSESMQNTDLKTSLKINGAIDQITISEVTEEVTDETAKAVIKGFVENDTNGLLITLSLLKENNLWKITQIN